MPPQTIDVAATFEVEQPGGELAPLKLTDLQHADPAAGPGALDASVLAVGASVEALRTQLATPIPVSLGSPVTLGAAVDVGDRAGRQLGHVQVDNFPAFPATQAVSAAALPLPTGAATAARQDTQAGKLDTLAAIDYATEGTLQSVSGKLGTPASDDMLSLLRSIAANTLLETTKTDVLQLSADQVNLNTDQVEAKLDTVSARIGTTGVPGSAVERIEAVRAAIAGTPAVSVSNWPATQPVSAAALPLPAGAATGARQDALNTLLGGGLPAALVSGRLDVNVGAMPNVNIANFPASQAVTGTFWQATQPVSGPLTDTQLRATAVPVAPSSVAPGNLRVVTVTAGTRVALNGSTLRVRRAIVCAFATNVGVVVVGGSGVIAAVATRNAPHLNAGDSQELGAVDLSATYLDSTVNGEGVTVYYEA